MMPVTASILLFTTMNWPHPAQLAGAFAGVGAHVEALCPPRAMLARSRHIAGLHRHNPVAAMESLYKAMAAAEPDMIVACDDVAGELVNRTQGDLSLGRMDFLTAAAKAGAPCLDTIALENEAQLDGALRKLGLPLVIKADHSWGGEGVVIANNREEARAAFRRLMPQSRLRNVVRVLRGRGSHFLTRAIHPVAASLTAQRFVEGAPATSSLACWNGEVVAAHHFDVLLTTTRTSPASVVATTHCPQMEDTARKIAATFDLSGLFGLDYIRDAEGKVHLLEMNTRATSTSHLALEADLVAALLTAAGLSAQARSPVTHSCEIALFPREWLRDPISPWLDRAYHDVPWDDPEIVQACVREAPPAVRDLLEIPFLAPLTAKGRIFRA
jgi:hypothetical protein